MSIIDFEELKTTLVEKFEAGKAEFIQKRPNILVCGYTGSGKTSLIQAVMGDLVSNDRIGSGAPKTMAFDKYESDNILIWDSRGLEMGQTEEEFTKMMREFVRSKQEDPNLDNHIHLVWYVIQGSGARVTECDLPLMKEIFTPESDITVITKRDLMRPVQLESIRDVLNKNGIMDEHIIATSDLEGGAIGCNELVDLSYTMLPDAYKAAFLDAQRVDIEKKIEAIRAKEPLAKKIVMGASGVAAGIGLIPIPLSDAALILPAQMGMIGSLAALYNLEKAMIANFALPFVTQCAGIITATSLTKLLPGIGSLINAGIAGSLTGAMGLFVKYNFENIAIKIVKNEPVPEFGLNVEQFKAFYNDYIKGKFPKGSE